MTNEEVVNEEEVVSENANPDLSMGVTTAGDPIAPNSALRAGFLGDSITNALVLIDTTTNAVVNATKGAIDAGADISTDSIDRINDLKQQLLDELNKVQKAILQRFSPKPLDSKSILAVFCAF